jgi:hypothetical protein
MGCGGMRSGSRMRRGRIQIRTITRRRISSGGLEYQLQLDTFREGGHKYDQDGGVMEVS